MPPPMQSDAKPFRAFARRISKSKVVKIRAPEAPIGWPNAIAPPFTLTRAESQPISRLTASACAAKASLISSKSKSPTCQPAFCRQRREAGAGPIPITAGSTPVQAKLLIRAKTGKPREAAQSASATINAAAPSLMPEAFAGRDRAVFGEGGTQLRERFDRRPVARELVRVENNGIAFAARNRNRNNLFGELARFLRRFGFVLRFASESVLRRALDAFFARDIFGRDFPCDSD